MVCKFSSWILIDIFKNLLQTGRNFQVSGVTCVRYSPFLMACYEPDTQEFQSVCRVMSGFSDSFYIEVNQIFVMSIVFCNPPLIWFQVLVGDISDLGSIENSCHG